MSKRDPDKRCRNVSETANEKVNAAFSPDEAVLIGTLIRLHDLLAKSDIVPNQGLQDFCDLSTNTDKIISRSLNPHNAIARQKELKAQGITSQRISVNGYPYQVLDIDPVTLAAFYERVEGLHLVEKYQKLKEKLSAEECRILGLGNAYYLITPIPHSISYLEGINPGDLVAKACSIQMKLEGIKTKGFLGEDSREEGYGR